MNSDLKPYIEPALRTLTSVVPVVGGLIAQAWSEFNNIKQQERINELFVEIGNQFKALESETADFKQRVITMPDLPRLLEDTVNAAIRESDDAKRAYYPKFFVNLVRDSTSLTQDERAYLLESLESLSKHDLDILAKFTNGGSRGDILTGTCEIPFAASDEAPALSKHYDETFSVTMVSTSKLEARGIILVIPNKGFFSSTGSGEWYDRYRERSWRLTAIGRKLLRALE